MNQKEVQLPSLQTLKPALRIFHRHTDTSTAFIHDYLVSKTTPLQNQSFYCHVSV